MPGPSPKRGKSATQARIESQAKATKALQLRALRYSYDQIAREVGYASKGAAHTAVKNALKSIPAEAAGELREIELQTLDTAQRGLGRMIVNGHLGAVDRLIKIMDHRAKLLGLYEPMPDTGVAEIAKVLGAWIGKVRDEDPDDDEEGSDADPADA
jgi:hypothetical protein